VGGELGATLGPQVFGKSAVRVEGGLTYFINAGAADAIRVNGAISVVSAEIGGGQLTVVPEDGLIDFGGTLKLDAGLKIEGEMFGWVESTRRFNVSGKAKVSIPHVSIADTAVEANLSDKGATACVEKFGLRVGASYRWAAGGKLELYDGMFSSCDIGRYRSLPDAAAFVGARAIRSSRQATAARAATITVPAGGAVVALELQGAGGAPRVRVTSPDGAVAETSDAGTTTDEFISAEDPGRGTTSFVLGGPGATGTWTFTPVEGSVPIRAVRRADELPAPKAAAKVSRAAGGRHLLRWTLERAKGQQVTFAVKGAKGTKQLFTTAGGSGSKTIDALSGGGRQQIVALVEQDGLPRLTRTLATFTASRAAALPAPKQLRLRRAGSTLKVTWRGVPGALGYSVDVELSDGRHLLLPVRARSASLSVGGVGRATNAKVSVRADGRGGKAGRPAIARMRSAAKKP
ncbi:MAG: hypothetical protein Q7T55_14165, partial [Solirubrobacteraceae bacterium]|nr:hypothetical protein [Solirubrobacteraceae bacterium]